MDEDLIVPQQDFLNALVKQDALDSNEDPDEVKVCCCVGNIGIIERKQSSGFRRIFTKAFDRLDKC